MQCTRSWLYMLPDASWYFMIIIILIDTDSCEEELSDQVIMKQIQFLTIQQTHKFDEQTCDSLGIQKAVIQEFLDKRKLEFPSLFLRQLELLVNFSRHKVMELVMSIEFSIDIPKLVYVM